MGLRNEDSLAFSFLLAIPAILGATVLAIKDVWDQHQQGAQIEYSMMQLAVGASVSFVIGIGALWWRLAAPIISANNWKSVLPRIGVIVTAPFGPSKPRRVPWPPASVNAATFPAEISSSPSACACSYSFCRS